MANTYELIVRTVDRSSRPLANIEKSLAKLESRSKAVNRTLAGVGAALVAVVSARGLKAVVDVTSRFEDLQTSLATVTGSAREGARAFEFVQQFASQTAFSVEDLTQTYIKLQGAGIKPTSSLLRTFSDAVSTSTDRLGALEAITDLFARSTAGGLGLEDLNRLADRGIPVFDILSEKLGLARLEVGKFGQTAEGAKTILDALTEGLNERFGGATERTLGNLSVLVSNLGDAVDRALAAFGRGFSPFLKEVIEGLTGFINTNESVFEGLGRALGEGLKSAADAVKSLSDSLGLLDPGGLEIAFGRLLQGLGTFLDGLISGFAQLGQNIAIVTNAMLEAIQTVKGGVILDVGVTREERIEELQKRLEELGVASKIVNGVIEYTGGLGALAFARFGTEVGQITAELDKLTDPSTQIFTRMAEDVGLAELASANLGERIRQIGDEMIAAGEKEATINEIIQNSYSGRGEMYERLGERAAYLAEQERLAAEAALQHANSNEQLLMSMQVIPTTLAETNAAFSELIQNTNDTMAQQELNAELVRRVTQSYQDGYISLEQYKIAMQQLGITIAETGNQLSGFDQFMRSTIDTAQASVNQVSYATQAQSALKQQLADGTITLDVYAEAMERVNGILGVSTEATRTNTAATREQLSVYEQATKAIADTNAKSLETGNAISKLQQDFNSGKYSLEEFRIGMENMGLTTDDLSDRSIAMGINITDAFTSAGDSLAQGLARGIARGESIMSSFKNFMQSILETILTQIIQQAFINPMIASMTAGFSQAFSAFGVGGVGAFGTGAGILGSLFGGGPLGLLGGFLGFANGGVVPGMPTRGDSVPILATPGEVILNKRQQAEVLQGGGEEPVTVNFNISAIDTQTGTEFILKNKKQITGVIQQAYNTRGQSGPLG